MNNKNVGFVKKLLLKFLTFLQVGMLKQDNDDFYYLLTKLHFKLFFGKNLVEEAGEYTSEFRRAKRRHSGMVISVFYPNNPNKKQLSLIIEDSFTKNLLLETKLS